ncbi:MBG domain-containing protein [Noviherbaspirillum humi]|uniref:MBG domain-containing protein n=1 Tax=Noviherbaspirillum humi TaxID=1688639 RepID=UPI0015953C44|nr:MBG domain-containing protein [Noviherbaspirillum humi]
MAPAVLPAGAQVSAGAASIAQSGSAMTVTQSTPKAILNWNSFDIGPSASVTFNQPSRDAVALNRVVGLSPSQIHGQLNANGQVFLVNPQGILFGPTAQVNVGGLVASTMAIADADFMSGNYRFERNGSTASVVNQGKLTAADAGYIALLAPEVINEGVITARLGTVAMAAGEAISLDFRGDGVLGVSVDAATVKTLVENRQMVIAEGGTVYLSAKAAGALGGVMVSNSGTVKATSLANRGGVIRLEANGGVIDNSGTLSTAGEAGAAGGRIEVANRADADRPVGVLVHTGTMNADGNGAAGGQIALTLDKLLSAGQISVNGSSGGRIDAQLTGDLLETTSAKLSANGTDQGGSITMQSSGGRLFSSGRYEAKGHVGGGIDMLGRDIALNAAALDASGAQQGGTIRIGGDWQGSGDVQRAQSTYVTQATSITADATEKGNGGKVVVWSDGQTSFYGTASARGGMQGGDGGAIEVSGKAQLTFGGMGDASAAAGKAGVLLLDPKNIVIDSTGSGIAAFDLLDPNPQSGGAFGASTSNRLTVLSNGNLAVAKPADSFVANNAGAAYLFNGTSGALISTLSGSQANDQVGLGGITALSNGNYVVSSYNWANGTATNAGAATWGNGATGITGFVSSTNSLVGLKANNYVSKGGITALSNGNYVVSSYNWTNGTLNNAGAVTWGNGASGITGLVTSSNSLVGSWKNDQVGIGGVSALSNGNYVVNSYNWANIGALFVGAVTWGNGTSGITGAISSSNSLIGSQANDQVGYAGITVLSNDNYVVKSPYWANGTVSSAGAATWGRGTSGVAGLITGTNSLVGSSANDQIGIGGVSALANGNYVVNSYYWANGTATRAGAATWGNGASGITGSVDSNNSLVGSRTNDLVSIGGTTALSNGNYVVTSYNWANGTNANAGAATWGNGTTGITGLISATNSLVGTTGTVGRGGTVALTNGNYVVNSYTWANGASNNAGAITWGDGNAGLAGTVSSTNSLISTKANDFIGYGGVTALSNGNYVVNSYFYYWPNGSTNAGAITWGNGTGGTTGLVSSTNSLVGAKSNDYVGYGGVTALSNGSYVVNSYRWGNGTATSAGAVTWLNGTSAFSGLVSSANSLVGSQTNDQVGLGGITALANSNFVVSSHNWANGTATSVGAVTWTSATSPLTGAVGASNSLVGSYAGDQMGASTVRELANGNVLTGASSARSGTTSNAGRISIIAPGTTNPSFGTYPAGDIYLNPAYLTKITNTGTSLVLQANNDITVNSAVTTSASGNGGTLTLQAGRSISLNASITTDNGNLTLIANDKLASGVVDAYRDPGTAVLSMASGTVLDAGTGNIVLKIEDGAGKTNKSYGGMTLRQVQGKTITATTPTGSNITLNGTVSATASGDSVVLAAGGNFVNNAGASAINPGAGRYLVYSQSPLLNTLGGLSALPLYNKTYAADPPATITSSGSRFIYSLAPTLTYTADNASRVYGDANPSLTYSVSGLVGSDALGTAASGSPTLSITATPSSNVGSYAISISQGSLVSDLGYSLAFVNGTLSVTPAPLTISTSAVTKTYDGTTSAAGNPIVTAGTLYNGTTLSGGSYAFLDKNAGTGKTVTVSAVTVNDGNGGGNYSVTYASNTGSTIDPKTLTVTAAGQNKVYDGTTSASVTLSDDRIAGDALSLSYLNASFADKHAGTGKTVSVNGLGKSGADAGNYVLAGTSAVASADITPASLIITADGKTKVYGDANPGLSATYSGFASGDTAASLTGALNLATPATAASGTGSYAITPSGQSSGDYSISYVPGALTVTPAPLNITADGKSKVYGDANPAFTASYAGLRNGDTAASLSGSLSYSTAAGTGSNVGSYTITPGGQSSGNYSITYVDGTLDVTPAPLAVTAVDGSRQYGLANPGFTASYAGFKNGESAASLGGTLTFSTAAAPASNVGSYSVTPGGYTSSNYSISYVPGTLTITPAPLTIRSSDVVKTYDGTMNAAGSLVVASGSLYNGNTLSGGSYAFLDKNAGTGKTVTVSGVTVNDGNGGSNYSVTYADNTNSAITPRALTVTASAQNKVYDGTVLATAALADDRIVGDALTTGYASAVFADRNAGTAKNVTVSGISLAGADAGNYTFNVVAGASADIAPRPLTVAATGQNKVYDGTTAATVNLSDDRIAGDILAASYTNAAFADKHAGISKAISVSGIAKSGTDAGNYVLANPSTVASADITPAALTITADDKSRLYGVANPALTAIYAGLVGGDSAASLAGTLSLSTPAGPASNVGAYAITPSGQSSGDYTISYLPGTLSVTPAPLTISSGAVTKTYDGTTSAAGNPIVTAGTLYNGNTLSGGSYAFLDKNAGTGKTVTVSGVTVSDGNGGGNYSITYADNTNSAINPKPLALSATAQNKTYDGTSVAAVSLADDRIAGDVLSAAYAAASFSDKNAGTGKTVTVSDLSLSGADARNYTVNASVATVADITPRILTVTATGQNKIYDGSASATVALLDDRIAGDALSISHGGASFADKHAGIGKSIAVSGISKSGADAGNYAFASTGATATADISPAPLAIVADDKSRLYGDANPAFTASYTGLRSGDTPASLAGSLTFSTPAHGASHVGSYAITPAGLSSGDYSISYVGGTLAVAPSPLTVTADNASRQYGLANPSFTASYSGFKNGDTASSLGGTLAFSTAATAGSNVGSYGIAPNGHASSNYSISYAPGTLTVTPAPITISSSDVSKIYDGTTSAAGSAVIASGSLYNGNTLTGGSYAFLNRNAGTGKTVTVTGVTVNDGNGGNNYSITYANNTGSTITRKPLAVTAAGQDKVYDGTTAAMVTLSDDRILGDALSISYGSAAFASKNAGPNQAVAVHGIAASGLDAANYQLAGTTAAATASIAKAPLTITADDKNRLMSQATPPFTATYAGLVAGESAADLSGTLAYATPATSVSPPGSYAIVPSGQTSSNYAISFAAGTLKVAADPLPAPAPAPVPSPSTSPASSPASAPVQTPPVNAPVSGPPLPTAQQPLGDTPTSPSTWLPPVRTLLDLIAPSGAAAPLLRNVNGDGERQENPNRIGSGKGWNDSLGSVRLAATTVERDVDGCLISPSRCAPPDKVIARRADGEPLPGWRLFDAESLRSIVLDPPPGSLPLPVELTLRRERGSEAVIRTLPERSSQ